MIVIDIWVPSSNPVLWWSAAGLWLINAIKHSIQTPPMFRQLSRVTAQSHYVDLLRFYAPHDVGGFQSTIEKCSGVVTGSAAIFLLLSPTSWTPFDLNIAVPAECSKPLLTYLMKIGYTISPGNEPHSVSTEYGDTVSLHNILENTSPKRVITISESVSDSTLPPVLGARSTAGMIYATRGGLLCAYPNFTLNHINYCPHGFFPCSYGMDHAPKTDGLSTISSNSSWSSPCDRTCPSLWRRLNGLRDFLVVTWNQCYSPLIPITDQHLIWRLTNTCKNFNCPNQLSRPFAPLAGLCTESDIMAQKMIIVRECAYESTVHFNALLYAKLANEPLLVPLRIDSHIPELFSIDDLDTRAWVRENGIGHRLTFLSQSRTTFTNYPGTSLLLSSAYTVCREHHDAQSMSPNRLLQTLFKLPSNPDSDSSLPKGNLLVIKHAYRDSKEIAENITKDEIPFVNQLIIKSFQLKLLFPSTLAGKDL
ncbi:hypothetical protein BV22DRAFT_1051906 [Leucogyrophana mollusca]|uniref:Uncharacterized protein n=1 Tax=Leucogyrophana mollusca TaxID=85980 RepID=A0ACB8AXC5_9AGAM|nr:hypothetical protein BV22DRAFT_1051906 [Leucogyrophana mollusca]